MTNPLVEVVYSARFRRDVKRLFKRYRHIREDIQPLIEQIRDGKTPGDRIQGTRYLVFKVRVKNSDALRGKSGGYRVIYYVRTQERITLITVYSKSDTADIPDDEIRRIIQEWDQGNE
jgi:mRNA-degrading endonuclease RelE of RelBE toxin-antitoxin system